MQKKDRMLEIFYRLMKGENVSLKKMAEEYGVSAKSISRDLSEIKNFSTCAVRFFKIKEILGAQI